MFDDYLRIAAGATTTPTALQLLTSSDTTAVLYIKGALTDELDATPGWTLVADDHGMLLYVSGDAVVGVGSFVRGRRTGLIAAVPSGARSTVHDHATDRPHRGNRDRQEHRRPDARSTWRRRDRRR